jgi:adenosylcobinamide-phosphate synthase
MFSLFSFVPNDVVFGAALLAALAIDHYLGEPSARLHPVVWMGNYLDWTGLRLAPLALPTAGSNGSPTTQSVTNVVSTSQDLNRFWLGAFVWCAGAVVVFTAAWTLQDALLNLPAVLGTLWGTLLATLGLGLALKPMLAWSMLRSEVRAVEVALNPSLGGSLAEGRERLSWLVSRDVSQLTASQVRESAIESLAENLNDSVVAPIFWFVLLGLPGAALYRFANTADAMWGYPGIYKGQNWAWAGKWAARADDVLSWIPARMTGYLLAGVYGLQTLTKPQPPFIEPSTAKQPAPMVDSFLARLSTEACRTPSPNSGWPMAAMALILNVRLHKPGVYVLNAGAREPQLEDTDRAIAYASQVLVASALISLIAVALRALGADK